MYFEVKVESLRVVKGVRSRGTCLSACGVVLQRIMSGVGVFMS